MAVFTNPFDALTNFQQALDTYRTSSWLDAGLSGGGAFPPLNVFRKGDDFIIIAELPGVKKSDLDADHLWRVAIHEAGHFEEAAQTCGASEPPAWGWGKGVLPSGTARGTLSGPRVRLLPSTGRDPFCGNPQIALRHAQLSIGSRRGTSARKGERHTSFVCA